MRSIESRIVTLFILIILGVQLAGFFSLRSALESKARSSMEMGLAHSERAIQRLLDQHTMKLTEKVTKLTSDSNFLEALSNVSNADSIKIESILAKQCAQMNASMGMLIGMDNQIQVTSSRQLSSQLKQASIALISGAEQQGYASSIVVNNHYPTQLIAALLKTPTSTAWIVMAFPLENNIILEMRQLTPLQVTMLIKDKQYWQVVSSSLSNSEAETLAKNVPSSIATEAKKVVLNDSEYSMEMMALTKPPSADAIVVIQGSISDMVAPYNKIQIGLILLTLFSLAVAVIGSITFTKRISQPLRQLRDIAKRLGAGDYDSPIQVSGDGEISELAHAFVSMRDGIAHRENEIKRLAYWDTLTDLPNRAQFTFLLKQAIAATKAVAATEQTSQSCFVLMMDLDRFKHVNDIMGHSFGDLLLKKVASRLREALPGAQLARLGGDEFALLLPNSNLNAAQEAALIILLMLEQPITLEDQAVDLGAGIGLAGYPEHGEDAEILLSHAEVAMYAAKRNVGSNFTVYRPEIDQSSQQNLSLLSELRCAIQENQLRLYVQPKLSLGEKEVVGIEALMRWEHPTRGFLVPDQFIPFAEQTGIIRLLTRWILDKSAALCTELITHGIHLKISVNISTHDLLDQDLPVKFADILTRHRVKTSSFCLEITESAIMNDPHRAQVTLERLNAMGVELSIDDFGTGYSSLAYLKRLPVDELKIDKSFVMHMENDSDDRKIVKSTIDLGHNMGLRVVAEGVEDAAVMALLTKMGCDQAQGNYINRAIPSEQLIEWLGQKETLFN
ncbi:GGDEF domain-containing phosphodiesterase [Solimicrobium silvestre]|uniref:GGDEF: diguanylate cyclase (GGDEF) domain n=1 Tax=Solimicrobium silvestre TaxID=2099400 RepID=A0A2S9H2I5_9BURK|nr:GGDEF domain-containing phosphodiesterase [Solimicrobium silvestre]PRC94170.1 GGDEF: diguanylate cyclase (GGDEF) domain [Solimicrobium silvestre]